MKTFEDFPDAFDYCREKDQPVVVLVAGEEWKLYPSGSAVQITPASSTSSACRD